MISIEVFQSQVYPYGHMADVGVARRKNLFVPVCTFREHISISFWYSIYNELDC